VSQIAGRTDVGIGNAAFAAGSFDTFTLTVASIPELSNE